MEVYSILLPGCLIERSAIEHNRTHKKILLIEHNRTFDYRMVSNRTQSSVRLSNGRQSNSIEPLWNARLLNSCLFDFVPMSSILFDWYDLFDNRTHTKLYVRLCSIAERNRTIGVRLRSIGFLFLILFDN